MLNLSFCEIEDSPFADRPGMYALSQYPRKGKVHRLAAKMNPRDMIHSRADWHLDNWRKWMRGYSYSSGYPTRSSMFNSGGISGDDAFDNLCQDADTQAARIIDSIIDGLEQRQQCAIHNIYLASVWRFRGDPVEIFCDAVEQMWRKAQVRGLA